MSKINKLLALLGKEEKKPLNQLELEDKTALAESFEVGQSVFFSENADNILFPEGKYTSKDGKQILSIDTDGKIVSLEEVPEEVPEAEPTEEEEKEEYVTQQEFAILVEAVQELQQTLSGKDEEMSELKKTLAATKKELSTVKTELSSIETEEVNLNKTPTKKTGINLGAFGITPKMQGIFKQFNQI